MDVLVEDGLRKVPGVLALQQGPRALPPPLPARLPSRHALGFPALPLPCQAINGFTWPGIEFGEPPNVAYTFFEVRRGACGLGRAAARQADVRCSPAATWRELCFWAASRLRLQAPGLHAACLNNTAIPLAAILCPAVH